MNFLLLSIRSISSPASPLAQWVPPLISLHEQFYPTFNLSITLINLLYSIVSRYAQLSATRIGKPTTGRLEGV